MHLNGTAHSPGAPADRANGANGVHEAAKPKKPNKPTKPLDWDSPRGNVVVTNGKSRFVKPNDGLKLSAEAEAMRGLCNNPVNDKLKAKYGGGFLKKSFRLEHTFHRLPFVLEFAESPKNAKPHPVLPMLCVEKGSGRLDLMMVLCGPDESKLSEKIQLTDPPGALFPYPTLCYAGGEARCRLLVALRSAAAQARQPPASKDWRLALAATARLP